MIFALQLAKNDSKSIACLQGLYLCCSDSLHAQMTSLSPWSARSSVIAAGYQASCIYCVCNAQCHWLKVNMHQACQRIETGQWRLRHQGCNQEPGSVRTIVASKLIMLMPNLPLILNYPKAITAGLALTEATVRAISGSPSNGSHRGIEAGHVTRSGFCRAVCDLLGQQVDSPQTCTKAISTWGRSDWGNQPAGPPAPSGADDSHVPFVLPGERFCCLSPAAKALPGGLLCCKG